jgi:hypothetical protein
VRAGRNLGVRRDNLVRGLDLPLVFVDSGHIGQKPIAAARDGLDETRILDRIAECFTDLADGFVEAMIKIYRRLRP